MLSYLDWICTSKENKEVLPFVLIFHAKLIPRYASLVFHCAP